MAMLGLVTPDVSAMHLSSLCILRLLADCFSERSYLIAD